MVKSNKVTLLIICFFAIAVFLNEGRPSEIAGLVETSLTLNTGSYVTSSQESGMVEAFNLSTFILLSASIIGGLFIITFLKLSRSGKIISTQSILLARQEDELQQARQVLADLSQKGSQGQ